MRLEIIIPLVVVGIVLICMALPPALAKGSWLRFLSALFLSFFGVLLPIGFFLLSALMCPEWKGGCRNGWIDCFMLGKMTLLPVVLWASAALYAVEILRVKIPTATWIVLGFSLGAVVSVICFLFGIAFLIGQKDSGVVFLSVPFYTCVWYSLRATQLIRAADLRPELLIKAACGSIPLWLGSFAWSWMKYQSLPVNPPECFVVTAAMRGHRNVVGPLIRATRRGGPRLVTPQLLTFWQFEALWRACAPSSHRIFRCGYNYIGPVIARQVNSPWLADAVFLALKPAEMLAGLIVRYGGREDCFPGRSGNN
jgi:hypothetical protein